MVERSVVVEEGWVIFKGLPAPRILGMHSEAKKDIATYVYIE
jgi:hypothetical protein